MISLIGYTVFVSALTNTRRYIRIILFVFAAITCTTLSLSSLPGAQQPDSGINAVAVNSPEIVRAGEKISFTITVDKAPNFKGGSIMYWVVGPDGYTIQTGIDIEPGKRVYQLDFMCLSQQTGVRGPWIG